MTINEKCHFLTFRTIKHICFILVIMMLSSFSAYADTWRALATDSGRQQWRSGDGYCGALAIQKIMLKYGIWVSQQEARSAGGGELLIGENYGDALNELHIDHTIYADYSANASDHLPLIRTALAAGNDYIIGAITNYSWHFDEDYDHIFAIHAIEGTSSGYSGSNKIYFNDSWPVASDPGNLNEVNCTWDQFSSSSSPCNYYFDNSGQWGAEIEPMYGWSGNLTLSVNSSSEPGESSGSTSSMNGDVHLTGLTSGTSYTIKKWEGTYRNYNGFSSSFSDIHTFQASGSTYDYAVSWIGGNIAIYDFAEDSGTADDESPWENQSIPENTYKHYTVEVPSGATSLTVTTAGSTGDADLFLNYDFKASSSNHDEKSETSSSNESVTSNNPAAGTWHIAVLAYSGSGEVTGLTVTATVVEGSGGGDDNETWTNQSTGYHDYNRKTFDVASGATSLTITTDNGTGDADLYLKRGSAPTLRDYDERSWESSGNDEEIVVTNPTAGTWHIGVYGYSAASGFTIEAKYE